MFRWKNATGPAPVMSRREWMVANIAHVASVMQPPPPVETAPGTPGPIPFRHATTERTNQLTSETAVTLGAGTQQFDRTVDGSGFIYGIVLRAVATAAANTAVVNFAEDAPYSLYDSVALHDVNGDVVNVAGFSLHVANSMLRDYAVSGPDRSPLVSQTNIVPGAAANGGTFAATMRVPVGINRRDLIGILGNQDRGQVYFLRTAIAASASVWGTAPTTPPTVTIDKHLETYSAPLAMAPVPGGPRQGQLPPLYGTIPLLTQTLSEAPPLGGATVNHFIRRVGNTIRAMGVIGRVNGSRATFALAADFPTGSTLRVGDETIFNELPTYRQFQNFEKYGQAFDDGVLVYDWMHDFSTGAGAEMGADWIYSQVVQNMQLQMTYPAAVGSTGNSLTIVTADMVMRAPVAA